jgi:hypothetical protein
MTIGAMVVAAWLLALLLVAFPVVSWLAVRATVHSALSAAARSRSTDPSAGYFIDNYGSAAQVSAALMLGLNTFAGSVLAVLGEALRRGYRTAAIVLPVASLPVLAISGFERLWNPVTSNWGGDPDAWAMVDGLWPSAYPPTLRTWLALVALACLVLALFGGMTTVRWIRGDPRWRTLTPL